MAVETINNQQTGLEEIIGKVFEEQRVTSLSLRQERYQERIKRLNKIKNWIETNRKKIQKAVYQDFKKPSVEVDISEIHPVLSEIKHFKSHLKSWVKPKKVDAPLTMLGTSSRITYEPKGVCLIIAPWNYPFNLTIAPLVSALAAGNTAILKPSEMTPHTSALITAMIGELFNKNEVAVFEGGAHVSKALLSMPFDHIFFTGSPAIGKLVMKAAAENLTSVTLELGGKSPAIVDETANLKDTAEKLVWGKFLNNGQTCIAPDYLLIHEKVKDRFIELFKSYTEKLYNSNGEGYSQSDSYARIVNERHFDRMTNLIDDAIRNGAKVEMGGEAQRDDAFIPPTLLTEVPADAQVMEEEIFGPILPVVTFSNLDETINIVNDKPKPLALYVFSRRKKNIDHVLTNTSSGGACINESVIQFSHNNLPFGGVNNSGIGKAHGYHGFLAFSNEKSVLKQRIGFTGVKLMYPPYSRRVKGMVTFLLKYF
ncbi:MAG: aldehyde dehydrogenase family protein [Bacteroidota bacterium]